MSSVVTERYTRTVVVNRRVKAAAARSKMLSTSNVTAQATNQRRRHTRYVHESLSRRYTGCARRGVVSAYVTRCCCQEFASMLESTNIATYIINIFIFIITIFSLLLYYYFFDIYIIFYFHYYYIYFHSLIYCYLFIHYIIVFIVYYYYILFHWHYFRPLLLLLTLFHIICHYLLTLARCHYIIIIILNILDILTLLYYWYYY